MRLNDLLSSLAARPSRRDLHRASGYSVSIAAALAAVMPTNTLRCAAYRSLGYRITGSRIGYGTLIDVESATITSSVVGPLNRFHGPFELVMDRAEVGAFNEFTCGSWAPHWACYRRYCHLRRGSLVTGNHLIDASGGFELGEDSWIGGRGSQVWTHAGDDDPENDDLAVTIGDHCFLGAGVLIAPGTSLASRTTVGMGSAVTGKFAKPRCLIGGVPASVIDTNYDPPFRRDSAHG